MSERQGNNSICITNIGMVASLGCAFDHACAAARAGLVRTQRSEYPVRPLETGDTTGLLVHAIPELTQGFEGDARRLRIMQGALSDLRRRDPGAPWRGLNTRFFLSVPDPAREYRGAALVPDGTFQATMKQEAKNADQAPYDTADLFELLQKAARFSGFGISPELGLVSLAGHCGVAQCIASAAEQLLRADTEMAIVGAVDSLLDDGTLSWLERTGRLKSAALAVGLAPGEAGVFLVLETLGHARARSASPLAVLTGLHFAEDDKPLWNGDAPLGLALSRLLLECSKSAQWGPDEPCWLLCDQNGESYRAMEWGQALVRALPNCEALRESLLWYPAVSFGETYAASGAVAMALVLHAWIRAYAPARHAVVLQSSDSAQRAAVVWNHPSVARPPTPCATMV